MKIYINGLKYGLGIATILGLFLGIGYLVIHARSGTTATAGDKLTVAKWNELVANSVPSGSVMAFNLSSCPTGWTEYTPAYGRFIRGIDKSGTSIDPSGQRALANTQEDAFQGHRHAFGDDNGRSNAPVVAIVDNDNAPGQYFTNSLNYARGDAYIYVKNPTSDGTNGTPRTTTETRPKNIALLYCVKN